jgi:SAM-dependent methyltransferase
VAAVARSGLATGSNVVTRSTDANANGGFGSPIEAARLHEHRRLWQTKPVLARVYRPWFDALIASAPRGTRVLEVGAGPGLLAAHARQRRPDLRWTASDLHPVPWNALAADAGRLPVATGAVGLVAGLDVLHHLPEPAAFFGEASRVLAAGGRLALVEPWITPLSWLVYRFFHQEDCRLSADPWRPFPEAANKDSFDGNAVVPWQLVRDTPAERWRALGLASPRVRLLNGFAYLLTLGFRPRSLLPLAAARAVMALDTLCTPLGSLFALRAEIVWTKAIR